MIKGKKIPEEIWEKFLQALQEYYGSVSHAAHTVGIERRSYYNKRLEDPEFALKADTLFDRVQVPIAEEMLRADVLERKAWAIRYTLDRSGRKWNQNIIEGYMNDIVEERLFNIEQELRDVGDRCKVIKVTKKSIPTINQVEDAAY